MTFHHGIAIEVWSSRFATALRNVQPSISRELALGLAGVMHSSLGLLRPEAAVQTFLDFQIAQHEQAVDITEAVLKAIRGATPPAS
jgi:hypothetical protein